MNTIQATISLPRMRKFVKMPQTLTLPPEANIVDVIGELDNRYFETIANDGKNHQMDFLNNRFKSAMQLLWNPSTGQFYADVGIECRILADDTAEIPVEKDWTTPLPHDAYVVVMPDAGC